MYFSEINDPIELILAFKKSFNAAHTDLSIMYTKRPARTATEEEFRLWHEQLHIQLLFIIGLCSSFNSYLNQLREDCSLRDHEDLFRSAFASLGTMNVVGDMNNIINAFAKLKKHSEDMLTKLKAKPRKQLA